MNTAQMKTIFQAYYQQRIDLAGAVLPEEKLAVLETMERELVERGVIPISDNQVAEFNPSHPVFAAILAGERVNVSGEAVGERASGLAGASIGVKIAILASILLIPMILVFALLLWRDSSVEEDVTSEMAMIEVTSLPTLTPFPTLTPLPTIAPVVISGAIAAEPTAETEVESVRGSVAPAQGDPASIELAGRSFILATGETKNGVWVPRGAEWLMGTTIRRVIAIPHSTEFEEALLEMASTDLNSQQIKIRLRSGDVVTYRIDETGWYRRDQIEVLTSDVPSVVVVISKGNDTTEQRLVISGSIDRSEESSAN